MSAVHQYVGHENRIRQVFCRVLCYHMVLPMAGDGNAPILSCFKLDSVEAVISPLCLARRPDLASAPVNCQFKPDSLVFHFAPGGDQK